MERKALEQLINWKKNKQKKPLIIRGARQVGKTWLMKEFAKTAYKKCLYINFEENETLRTVFEKDYDVERILLTLQYATNTIVDENTLLIFDELQEAPRGLTALKYFYEKSPKYQIIAAGSLLGLSLHANQSFPVGKVDFIDLYPLSFIEFLAALGQKQFVNLLTSHDWEMINTFHSQLCDLLRQYYYVGGMPEAVAAYAATKDYEQVRHIQQGILRSYDVDFSKHAPINEVPRIRMVWKSIPAQLSKENRKFVYGLVKEGARAKDFELAIEWLVDAGLVYRINRSKRGLLPLSAYEDFSAFKLFILDTGLMAAMNNMQIQTLLNGNSLFGEYKGALTEQFVHQQLCSYTNMSIYYWSAASSRGEIDFLVQRNDVISPIEVKAEENLQAKSLKTFVEKNPQLHGIRFSMSPHRQQEWMTNYPLYSVEVAL